MNAVAGLGTPASNVSAVVLNVTVTDTTQPSFLSVSPGTAPSPTTSNLNFLPNETVPNRVIVPVDSSGNISFYNDQGNVNVIADINGWYTSGTGPSTGDVFVPAVSPIRNLDTRFGPGALKPVGQTTVNPLNLGVSGFGYVPSGVDAVVENVTVANPTAASFLTVFPLGPAPPLASDLNFNAGEIVPNLVVVKLNSAGASYFNANGQTDVIADVAGWYVPAP
jgi:hypothetical protein